MPRISGQFSDTIRILFDMTESVLFGVGIKLQLPEVVREVTQVVSIELGDVKSHREFRFRTLRCRITSYDNRIVQPPLRLKYSAVLVSPIQSAGDIPRVDLTRLSRRPKLCAAIWARPVAPKSPLNVTHSHCRHI